MNDRRITRLIRLVQILNSGESFNVPGLAKTFDVSRRTVFRDIEVLRFAGMSIHFDEDYDRYSITKSTNLSPANLTEAESLSLVEIAMQWGQLERLPISDAASTATYKLKKSLPPSLQRRLRTLRRAVVVQPSPVDSSNGKASIFQRLVRARLFGRVIKIEYDAGQGQSSIKTNLRTYVLSFCQHRWFAIGRSSLHREVHTFALGQILSLKYLPKTFQVPRDFSIERYIGNAWSLHPDPGNDYAVVIRFSPMVAQSVADAMWHKTQRLEYENDGSLLFHAQVSGLDEITSWVLAYGEQAEVIQPDSLRHLVSQRARDVAAIYDRRLDLVNDSCGPQRSDRSHKPRRANQARVQPLG